MYQLLKINIMKKIMSIFLVILLSFFSVGFINVDDINVDLNKLSFSKIDINGSCEYIFDGENFGDVESLIINNYDNNAVIEYERNIVYNGGHYLLVYVSQYATEISSISISFKLKKTR